MPTRRASAASGPPPGRVAADGDGDERWRCKLFCYIISSHETGWKGMAAGDAAPSPRVGVGRVGWEAQRGAELWALPFGHPMRLS